MAVERRSSQHPRRESIRVECRRPGISKHTAVVSYVRFESCPQVYGWRGATGHSQGSGGERDSCALVGRSAVASRNRNLVVTVVAVVAFVKQMRGLAEMLVQNVVTRLRFESRGGCRRDGSLNRRVWG